MSRIPPAGGAKLVRAALASQRERWLALARRHGGPGIDADEVFQETARRALGHAEQLRDSDRAEAWVARIARNTAIDELRRRKPAASIAVEDVESPSAVPAIDCGCVLVQAGLLKPEYADILKRVDVRGAAVSDVARELGLSANNAMVRLHRARKALRNRMAEHCGTTSARSCGDCGCEERGCCDHP